MSRTGTVSIIALSYVTLSTFILTLGPIAGARHREDLAKPYEQRATNLRNSRRLEERWKKRIQEILLNKNSSFSPDMIPPRYRSSYN
tara:strand:+ start:275 stop:535 length:261 start_codon:yes stop_codon:yes gene_type:complete